MESTTEKTTRAFIYGGEDGGDERGAGGVVAIIV